MPSLVIVFLAIAVIGWTNKVESSPAQTLDLRKILELVQQHRLNTGPSKTPRLQLRIMSSDSESDDSLTDSDESDDSDKNSFASIKKGQIIDLLQTAAKTKSNNNRLLNSKAKKTYLLNTDKANDLQNQQIAKERIINLIEKAAKEKTKINHLTNSKAKKNYGQITVKSNDLDNKRLEKERIIDLLESVMNAENNGNVFKSNRKGKANVRHNVQESNLVKLFSKFYDEEESKKEQKKKLIPNRLTPTVTMDDVKKYYEKQNNNQVEMSKNNEVTGFEDYSKIYIVLNPQAVQNSKNKNALNDLISKVLSLSSPTLKRVPEVKKMPRRYKGFLVDDNLQLRRLRSLTLDDDDKKIDPVAVPLGEITAVPV